MMKNYSICLVLLLAAFTVAKAQTSPYTFEVRTGTYQSISQQSGVQEFPAGSSALVPLGFTFLLDGQEADSVDLSYDGFTMAFPNNDVLACYALTNNLFYLQDLVSKRLYISEGVAGERVATFEFKQLAVQGSPGEYISLQVKVFEKNMDVLIHYGSNNFSNTNPLKNGSDSVFVVLGKTLDDGPIPVIQWLNNLYGDSQNPMVNKVAKEDSLKLLNAIPLNNTVYLFKHNGSNSISESNQFTNYFKIKTFAAEHMWVVNSKSEASYNLRMVDELGREVSSIVNHQGELEITNESLSKGVYTIMVEQEGKVFYVKLLK